MSRLAEHLNRAWLHRGLLSWVLLPLSGLMSAMVFLRRAGYRHGWLRSIRLPVPVLVVGNRIVGGAGKTPTTIAILQHLQARGLRPGVLTRGYKASKDAPPHHVLLDASTAPALIVAETGDEPLLIWRRTQVPMAIGRDRAQGGQILLAAHPDIDILVCDDGLQHLQLQRDIEVIVFDERGQGNGWLLPAGPLREPIDSPETPGLKAPALVLYNAPQASTHLPGFTAQRRMAPLVSLAQWWQVPTVPNATAPQPPQPGNTVLALAGIAQPQRFFQSLQDVGLTAQGISLADHADFTRLPWADAAVDLIVTEKDAVKLDPIRLRQERPLTRVWVAGLDFYPEDAFWIHLDAVLDRLPFRHTRASPAVAAPLI